MMRETMNHFKKMAFGLALVAGLCGGAWAADWGHRNTTHAQASHAWRGSAAARSSASVPTRTWNSHTTSQNSAWGAYRNNPNYQYRNGQWVYVPNRTWGTYYPSGTGTYYPYPTTGTYYPYPTTGTYYPYPTTGGYYPYPTTGGYYPGGGYGGYSASSVEYQRGYRDGLAYGRSARAAGYRDHPYQQAPGAKSQDYAYRQGYTAGYQRGYMRGF